jgi:hypothetical protein
VVNHSPLLRLKSNRNNGEVAIGRKPLSVAPSTMEKVRNSASPWRYADAKAATDHVALIIQYPCWNMLWDHVQHIIRVKQTELTTVLQR